LQVLFTKNAFGPMQLTLCTGRSWLLQTNETNQMKSKQTRQHRKALWHNGCPSHNLLRRLILTHDLDSKRGEGMQEWKT